MSSELNFKHQDTRLLLSATVLLAVLSTLVWWGAGARVALLVTVILSFAGLAGLLLNVYRSRLHDDRRYKEHIQALLHLFDLLDVRGPLPSLTGWAASPQLACTLVSLVREHNPDVVVELGSGSSTLVLGYALEQHGHGRVFALDHLETYATRTDRLIRRHALSNRAEVRHAPLVDVELDGETWPWYDPDALDGVSESIDMVFVDGPPHEIRSRARYPALPVLIDQMSEEAVIVLDDAYRDDESAIAEAWAQDFPEFELEIESSPYGTAILRRSPSQ